MGTGRKGEGEALFTAAALFTALFFLNLFSLSSMHLLRLMEADPCRVLETPLIMCERNCHGLTCTILFKKLNFLLAILALEQGGKGGEAQGSAVQQIKQILCKGSLFFFWRWISGNI